MHWFFLFYLLHHNKEKFIEIIEFSKDVIHVLNNNINNIVHQQQQQQYVSHSHAPLPLTSILTDYGRNGINKN